MLYDAVLFDLDGTLLDTLEDIGSAVNRVLAEREFPTHPMEAYRLMVGDGVVKLMDRALPAHRRDPQTLRVCLEAYRDDYGRNWNVRTRPYAGVSEMLDALAARGLKLAVLSNKPDEFTQRCVRDLLNRWRFDVVWGERAQVPRKPDPTAALHIAQSLSVGPARVLYVGDTSIDMHTARAAGMFAVGVLWGFRGREELERSGAQAIVEHPMEVLPLLDGSASER